MLKNNSNLKFEMPPFKRGVVKSGVYKITIDDKWFYIGSTKNLRTRLGYWKTCIRIPSYRPMNMKKVLRDNSVIRFEILKELAEGDNLRAHEELFLKTVVDHANCLNRCPSAFSPKGIKPCIGQEDNRMFFRKPKEDSKEKNWIVLQINKHGEIVARHHGILKASKSLGGRFRDQICKLVNGDTRYKSAGGYNFVYEKNYKPNAEVCDATTDPMKD